MSLALGAAWLAGLPAGGSRTFGWKRAEVLAALVNAVALVVVGALILWEAAHRLADPPPVQGLGVLVLGVVAVVGNGIPVLLLLRHGERDNINVRAALAHAAVSDPLPEHAAVASQRCPNEAADLSVLLRLDERADPWRPLLQVLRPVRTDVPWRAVARDRTIARCGRMKRGQPLGDRLDVRRRRGSRREHRVEKRLLR